MKTTVETKRITLDIEGRIYEIFPETSGVTITDDRGRSVVEFWGGKLLTFGGRAPFWSADTFASLERHSGVAGLSSAMQQSALAA